jgi:DNA-binding transcriptional LysR family regulator
MRAVRTGLSGHIRLAAIPTALAMVRKLTEPFQKRHPDVTFTILSRNSLQVLSMLENLEIDAGITYLDNEPLGRVTSVPLYSERYHLISAAGTPLADRESVTWREAAEVKLCLLTPDMQNRRIINLHMAEVGVSPRLMLESNSMIVLFSHIRTGQCASIMPRNVAESFGFPEEIRMIPITEPHAEHLVGLVATHREPYTPLVSALLHEARARVAARDFDRNLLSSDGNAILT